MFLYFHILFKKKKMDGKKSCISFSPSLSLSLSLSLSVSISLRTYFLLFLRLWYNIRERGIADTRCLASVIISRAKLSVSQPPRSHVLDICFPLIKPRVASGKIARCLGSTRERKLQDRWKVS